MPSILASNPVLSLRLYKTISRQTVDGESAVSARYQGKDEYIDLTPYLDEGSSVRTTKSVREPAGGFTITFADRPNRTVNASESSPGVALESIYGLVEPMDMVEIRMWSGIGFAPDEPPVIMRGFVGTIQRSQQVTREGRPQRTVVVSGQDYGKIWQMYQVIYLAAYAKSKALLTSFNFTDLFGVKVRNAYPAAEFVRIMVTKILNPFLDELMPKNSPLPRELQIGDSISVAHGVVNNSWQNQQGSIYDILKLHCDVPTWNELYVEDREDGVHVVYRPVPALSITPDADGGRKIQADAPDPVYADLPAALVESLNTTRSDAGVANFYWVNNSRFDLIDEMQRKLAAIPAGDKSVVLDAYANADPKYYGTRPMYSETQQGEDSVANMGGGQDKPSNDARNAQMESWIAKRRKLLVAMNKDNVVLESGTAVVKGGPVRRFNQNDEPDGTFELPDGTEPMRAGDYAMFYIGQLRWGAYCHQVDHEFRPFESYTTTLSFERGEGFVARMSSESGTQSPWMAEQATGAGG